MFSACSQVWEKAIYHAPPTTRQIQHKSEFTQCAWTSLTSADSIRTVYFTFNFYVSCFCNKPLFPVETFLWSFLHFFLLLLKVHLNLCFTKTLLSWYRWFHWTCWSNKEDLEHISVLYVLVSNYKYDGWVCILSALSLCFPPLFRHLFKRLHKKSF